MAEELRLPAIQRCNPFGNKKRMIAGRFAKRTTQNEHSAENDCYIIETLIHYFDGETKGNELLLCTENLDAFGVEGTLHNWFQAGLPTTKIVKDLKSLIAFINEGKPIKMPSPEEIEKAEKERAEQIAREQEAARQWGQTIPAYTVGQAVVSYAPYSIGYFYQPSGQYVYQNPSGSFIVSGEDPGRRQADDEKKRIDRQLERQRLRDQLP